MGAWTIVTIIYKARVKMVCIIHLKNNNTKGWNCGILCALFEFTYYIELELHKLNNIDYNYNPFFKCNNDTNYEKLTSFINK